MTRLNRIGAFLHITDCNGNLDLVDLSFMLVVGKVILSPGIDYPAVCSLVPVILAKMHKTHSLRSNKPQKNENQD